MDSFIRITQINHDSIAVTFNQFQKDIPHNFNNYQPHINMTISIKTSKTILNHDMTELYLITLGIIDELQDSILPEASLWYLHSTIDFVQPMITELQQAEKKAYASNLCIPSNWIHSIKQAHSFAEEFISICKNMIASEYDSTNGTRYELNNAIC